ncbi:sn-1-specific diacylglycerol lipase ABHD11-like [Culicoides brevitarsis]|uniref:sn-1-specific diacylglycerol lipase ABHD11-like n=1 Tax=Culicoides brevitarsis TaxID=469753 RepID=UPI00307BE612
MSVVLKHFFRVPTSHFGPRIARCYSTKLVPVPLAYASYEKLYKSCNDSTNNPMIVMHGLFGAKGNWNSLCKAMHAKTNPSKRIISVDARNHGESPHTPTHSYELMAEDIVELLRTLEIKKAILVGHSMGGRCMAYVALKYPHLVEKLIVVDITPVPGLKLGTSQTDIPFFLQAMKSIKIPADQTIHQGRKFADAELSKIIAEKSLRDFLITNLMKEDSDGEFRWRINIEALEQNFESSIMNFPPVDGLRYEGKTLFIGGEMSDYIKKQDFPKIQELFPNSELTYVKGAGHWVHSQKPNEFLELVLNFIKS